MLRRTILLCDHSPHSYLAKPIIDKEWAVESIIMSYNDIVDHIDTEENCTIIVPDPEKYSLLVDQIHGRQCDIRIEGLLYPNPIQVSWTTYVRLGICMLWADLLLNGIIKVRPKEMTQGIVDKLYATWIVKLHQEVDKTIPILYLRAKKVAMKIINSFESIKLKSIELPRVQVDSTDTLWIQEIEQSYVATCSYVLETIVFLRKKSDTKPRFIRSISFLEKITGWARHRLRQSNVFDTPHSGINPKLFRRIYASDEVIDTVVYYNPESDIAKRYASWLANALSDEKNDILIPAVELSRQYFNSARTVYMIIDTYSVGYVKPTPSVQKFWKWMTDYYNPCGKRTHAVFGIRDSIVDKPDYALKIANFLEQSQSFHRHPYVSGDFMDRIDQTFLEWSHVVCPSIKCDSVCHTDIQLAKYDKTVIKSGVERIRFNISDVHGAPFSIQIWIPNSKSYFKKVRKKLGRDLSDNVELHGYLNHDIRMRLQPLLDGTEIYSDKLITYICENTWKNSKDVIAALPIIKPYNYYVASSNKHIDIFHYEGTGKLFPLNREQCYYRFHNSNSFQLPTNQNTPIIMVASMSGISPFLHWVEMRPDQDYYLFYTCPTLSDWIYGDLCGSSKVTICVTEEFSNPISIADELIKQQANLLDLIGKGAHLFLCIEDQEHDAIMIAFKKMGLTDRFLKKRVHQRGVFFQ